MMMFIAVLLEWICWIIFPIVEIKPLLTPISVGGVCCRHTFTDAKARKDLGYSPLFTPEESMRITMRYFGLDKT